MITRPRSCRLVILSEKLSDHAKRNDFYDECLWRILIFVASFGKLRDREIGEFFVDSENLKFAKMGL